MKIVLFLIFAYFNYSFGAICDKDHPCPSGYVCRPVSYLPGVRACLHKSSVDSGSVKRNGRCPSRLTTTFTAMACNGNEDCVKAKRCCPVAYGGLAYCTDPVALDPKPIVTTLVEGYAKYNSDQSTDFVGSSTLVQSRNYNILVDTSSARTADDILKNLWSKAGLTFEDVDLVVTTHGHPDHFSSLNVFAGADQLFDGFLINGKNFKPNPLIEGKRLLLNDDPDIEVLKTPGHTPQCLSVLVKNVAQHGIVAIVGDLFIYKNDDNVNRFVYNVTLAEESRKRVACAADYIVPGHGPMFKVDFETRMKYNC